MRKADGAKSEAVYGKWTETSKNYSWVNEEPPSSVIITLNQSQLRRE